MIACQGDLTAGEGTIASPEGGTEKVPGTPSPRETRNLYFLKDPAGTGLIEVIPMPESHGEKLGDISTEHVHLAFDVEDMDEAVAGLEAAGVEMEGPPTQMGANRLLFFRDPEGAPMQLVQRPKPLV